MKKLLMVPDDVRDGLNWPAISCFPRFVAKLHNVLGKAEGMIYRDKDVMLVKRIEFRSVEGSYYQEVAMLEVEVTRFNERSEGHYGEGLTFKVFFKGDGSYYEPVT